MTILTAPITISNSENANTPFTITLKSSNVTRKIEISTDGGVEYFQPPINTTTATMLVVVITAPMTNIKITGVIGDELHVVGN